jgi:hypothetical protein
VQSWIMFGALTGAGTVLYLIANLSGTRTLPT